MVFYGNRADERTPCIPKSRKSNSGRLLAGESENLAPEQSQADAEDPEDIWRVPGLRGSSVQAGGLKKRDSDVREDSGSGPGWLYLMASSSELCL